MEAEQKAAELELRKLQLQVETEREERRQEFELRKLQIEREERRGEKEAEERREALRLKLEEEKVRRETPSSQEEDGSGVERTMVRSLQLIPEFDEERVSDWFSRFEKKAYEFSWPENRWVSLVANKLKGKALEAYDKMSV